MKEKLRVTRMENEHYRSISNNQEQDLIGWKVSTFEKIALLDTNVRKTLEDAQSGIEQKAKASIDAKLDQTEQRMKTLFSCVEALQARYKRESKNLQDKKSQAAALEETVESQRRRSGRRRRSTNSTNFTLPRLSLLPRNSRQKQRRRRRP